MKRLLIPAAVLSGLLSGCWIQNIGREPQNSPNSLTGRIYQDRTAVGADLLPYKEARINLVGTEVPVTMTRRVDGNQVVFDLVAKGEVLETEQYESDDQGFRFVSLTGESFVPPIPIVRYPFQAGEKWDWTGQAGLGSLLKPATAALDSSTETLNLATGVSECVLVTASLVVDTGAGGQSKRKLKFWIEPKRGVVKREFGLSTSREPRATGDDGS